jgi:dTDP-4-amino-4,6-dideoxygalactose transaminase
MKSTLKVPLLDLEAHHSAMRDEINKAIEAVLHSQQFIDGPQVAEFEAMVANYSSCAAAVAVSSGTDALLASLMSLGIGVGDEVITTPYAFFSTAGSIWRVGATPVFVDIEPETFNIDATRIEGAVTERTRAVIPVHLFGQVAEMDPILEIARKHGLHVIEDAAQALGATYRGRKAGSMGTLGCFSFYPSKTLGGIGDGGMVVTQDESLAQTLRECRNHGSNSTGSHRWVGGNFRLDTLQAATLIVKMRYLESWQIERRANAARYDELLANVPGIVTPKLRGYNQSTYNHYVIRIREAGACRKFLARNGIGCAIYYPLSLHQQECFASLGYGKADFPASERAATEALAIPMYPELTEEQIGYVANKLAAFVSDSTG